MEQILALKKSFADGALSKTDYISKSFEVHKTLIQYRDILKTSDIEKIEITADDIIITVRNSGIKMLLDYSDKRCTPLEILNFGKYENEDAAMVYALIKPGATILDIGANLGWYSLHFSKLVQGNGVIHAFEPIPDTYKKCKANIELNHFTNIRLNNFALSDSNGEIEFYYNPASTGSSSMKNLLELENTQLIKSKIQKLDDYVTENKLVPDFIKCDVEGAELLVFKGALEVLQQYKPIVFTEMLRKWSAKYNYHPNDIIQLFTDKEYNCYYSKNNNLIKIAEITDSTEQTNFFFLHKEQHADIIKLYESK